MASSYNHQDWTPVVLRKPKSGNGSGSGGNSSKATTKQQPISFAKNSNMPASKLERMVDDPDGKTPLKYQTSDSAKEIRTKRMELKMTQHQLACKLNMDVSIIQSIESASSNNKTVNNNANLSKIRNYLNKMYKQQSKKENN